MKSPGMRKRLIFPILLVISWFFLTAVNVPKERIIVEADPVLSVSYEEGFFIYTMPNGASFTMNCPLGGVIDEAVEVNTGKDAWIVSFMKDGESCLPGQNFHSVSEALASMPDHVIRNVSLDKTGSYLFHIRSTVTDKSGRETYDVYGGFRIAASGTTVGSSYIEAPYDYEISAIFLNGKKLNTAGGERAELPRDGQYEVHFSPVKGKLPEWTTFFFRDTTAPALIFNPPLEGDTAGEPVSFRPTEADARIQVLLNNNEVTLHNMTAAANGRYIITVSDSAGNSNEYSFNVEMKEKTSALPYFEIVLIIIVLSVSVVIFEHRRMRII